MYLNYGIHYLVNVVTEASGSPAAVLIRALDPLDGVDVMRRRRRASDTNVHHLCRGPGNLTTALGIPGLYVTEDPGGVDENARFGNLSIRIGLGWAKSLQFTTGQCPVMKYNRQLMMAILYDKIKIAKAVNVTVITLDEGPQGYRDFDRGAAKKFVLDPHHALSRN